MLVGNESVVNSLPLGHSHPQNVITHIDGATGDVTENPEVLFSALGQERLACPSWAGGKDWEAGAYSPLTHTMYFPLRNACQRLLSTTEGGSSTYPVTFAVDGRQYVAVGTGTSTNASINLRMTPELRPSFGNNLFVFALPDTQ